MQLRETLAMMLRDKAHWARLADGLAIAVVASLPWSTSATGILSILWLIAVIPTLDGAELRRVLCTPAGGLPILLCLLALAGMLWAAGVPLAERLDGIKSYLKFLAIPLLIVQFQRSGQAAMAMKAFLISCGVLLLLSWALFAMPRLPWAWTSRGGRVGVPVKDYISQSSEFTACAMLLMGLAWATWRERQRAFAIALALLALAFVLNILWISISRTALVAIPVLVLLFAVRHLPWKATAGLLMTGVVVAALAWWFAPEMRNNVTGLWSEVRDFDPGAARTRAGERIEFWKKSIGFIADAPLIGHGTGSIRDQFRHTVEGQSGMAGVASSNPHNQTLAVAIQLGLAGAAVLIALWIAHVLLFRGEGLIAWAGTAIVVQNIVSSLFNSHLFDFTQGWGYVLGVGIAGGALLRSRDQAVAAGAAANP